MIRKYYKQAVIAVGLTSSMFFWHHHKPVHNPFVQIVIAQGLPAVVHLEWNKNPELDVTGYLLILDNGSTTNVPNQIDATCNCIKGPQATISDTGTHIYTLRAQNAMGLISPTTTINFALKPPSAPSGGTVKLN